MAGDLHFRPTFSYKTIATFTLRGQGARWMRRYNDTPKPVLGLRTPNEGELDSLARLLENTGEVRCPKMLKRLTSPDI